MKKILPIILSVTLMAGAASAAYAATETTATNKNTQTAVNAAYTDIKTTNWAYEAVNAMSGKGIIKGYEDGSFKPQSIVTYGEFIKMALISDTGEDIGNAPVVDKETGAKQNWAQSYYDKALELKYFGSTDIKAEQLNKPIPRGDMALVMSNILGETKIENYAELQESLTDINASVRNEYDIVKVYASGIITGYEDGSFKPENTLTRAESATVIYRLVDESKRMLPGATKEEGVKTNVSELMSNYKDFWIVSATQTVYDEDIAKVTSYKIISDASLYDMHIKEWEGYGKTSYTLECNIRGTGYLIKDGKIIEYVGAGLPREDKVTRGRGYKSDITTVDYIAFIPSNTDDITEVEMTVIVNPFKK